MKSIAFGIAFAGTLIGYGIAATRAPLTDGGNATCAAILTILFLGMALS